MSKKTLKKIIQVVVALAFIALAAYFTFVKNIPAAAIQTSVPTAAEVVVQ